MPTLNPLYTRKNFGNIEIIINFANNAEVLEASAYISIKTELILLNHVIVV